MALKIAKKWKDWISFEKRIKIAYGGRSSGKSHTIAMILLIKGVESKIKVLCVREFQKNLDQSVHSLLKEIIQEDAGLSQFYKIMREKIVGANGTEFVYSGVRNAQSIKSFHGADYLWIEEGQSISYASWEILLPTIRKKGSEIWVSMNPYNIDDVLYQQIHDERDDQMVMEINYMDNPFNPDVMIREADIAKSKDEETYNHVWLGYPRSMHNSIIYSGKWSIHDFDIKSNPFGHVYHGDSIVQLRYGIDFGFSSPSGIVESFIDDGWLYIHNEIYEAGLQADDIIAKMYDIMPNVQKGYTVFADPNRPETIAHIADKSGMNIIGAIKGSGSVIGGISYIKNLKGIRIHPRCVNTIQEIKSYAYKTLPSGRILDHTDKVNDHLMDAMRYSLNYDILNPVELNWINEVEDDDYT